MSIKKCPYIDGRGRGAVYLILPCFLYSKTSAHNSNIISVMVMSGFVKSI